MAQKKLPKFITQEEFEKMHSEALKLEKKASKKVAKKIKQYRLAMLLAFESGCRISEIVGLKDQISKCCGAEIVEERK